MSLPPPTPAAQVAFLRSIQRILTEGAFVASYKYALLHALADLAVLRGDESGDSLGLTTFEIAERFVEVYWTHATPYPGAGDVLKQNTGGQAAVINRVAEARADVGGSLGRLRVNGQAWKTTVKRVEGIVKAMPLWQLQTVGNERLDFLYDNLDQGSSVTLNPGVAYCLRAFHGLVTELVRGAWLRYLRRRNSADLGGASDLSAFLFGRERADLSRQASILRAVQGGTCFYCRGALRQAGEVDHFVPWARYPVDLGHNFVLAHTGCNNDKSDALAAVAHLERWCRRNEDAGDALAAEFDGVGARHDLAHSFKVASWSYSQAETVGSRLWVARKADLVAVDPAWRSLPGMVA